MSNIALRTNTGGLAGRPDAGVSSSVGDVNFTGEVLEFSNLPSEFPSGGTGLVRYTGENFTPTPETTIAEMAWQLDKARRRGTNVVQRRMGWRAHHRGIEVLIVERLLDKGGDGKFRPSGNWALADKRTLSGKPTVRQATFSDPSASPSPAGGPGGGNPGAEGTGEHTMSYLPEPVRMSLRHNVETPSFNEGELVQVTSNAGIRHEVALLRSGGGSAVAVKGVRTQSGLWTVTMAVFRGSID